MSKIKVTINQGNKGIPTQFASNMGIYEFEIKDVHFKVSVIDHAAVIDSKISELSGMLLKRRRVVGFDVKFNSETKFAEMLIIHAANLCLAIQLCRLSTIPESLKNFLADNTICFVGIGMDRKAGSIQGKLGYTLDCYSGIDLGLLAARVLKNPKLIELTGIADLAKEVGIDRNSLINKDKQGLIESVSSPNWRAWVFTDKQVLYAVEEAYGCYVVADKMLSLVA